MLRTLMIMMVATLCANAGVFETKAIDGEGEVCPLDEVVISEPPDGATIYLGPSAGATDIPLRAQVSCISDTQKLDFFVKRPSDSVALAIGTDIESPFSTILQDILPSSAPQVFTFTAEATPKADEDNPVRGTSVVNIVQVGTAQDADSNSLPDDPFVLLDAPGDRWVSTGAFAGAAADLISAALVLYGDDAKQTGSGGASITLTPPDASGQSIEMDLPDGLVADNEVGIVFVQAAVDLGSLVGTVEENNFTREPSGVLVEGGVYTAVTVIVSDDNGKTFEQAPASRLSGNPITLQISGIELDATKEYVVAQHAATMQDTTSGIQLRHATGTWRQPTVQSFDDATDVFTAELTSFGVATVYFLVDDTSVCGEEGCPPGLLWIELLLGFAFFILNFANGGVGGGDGPCFIATAAYGTPMAAQIDVLREFRDAYLLDNTVGSAFVDSYYRLSPPVADAVASSPALAAAVRLVLLPVLFIMRLAMLFPALTAFTVALLSVSCAYRVRHRRVCRKL